MLRPARPDDAQAMEELRVAAWRAAYTSFMPSEFLSGLNPADRVAGLAERLSNQSREYWATVAEIRDEVVGFTVLGQPRYEADAKTAELWALYVNPLQWRKGIGGRLLAYALNAAYLNSYRQVELWCLKGNEAAQKAYEKAGFTLSGKERHSSNLIGTPLHELQYVIALQAFAMENRQ